MNKKILVAAVTLAVILLALLRSHTNGQDQPEVYTNTTPKEFGEVRAVSVYESATDAFSDIRDANKMADIFAETGTDYVHRGFFRYSPDVDDYDRLKRNIATIKRKNPGIIFGTSLIVSQVDAREHDPRTGDVIPESKIQEMAFDPQKWNINYELDGKLITREELHRIYAERAGRDVYLPDITNAEYKKLVMDIIKKGIDSGADAVWIDGFYLQADLVAEATGDVNHPAVKAAFEAYSKIVDDIHNYGASKGKRIYVGSWGEAGRNPQTVEVNYPFEMPKLDFVTIGISHKEMRDKKPDRAYWDWKTGWARKNFGNVPLIAVIDWSFGSDTALGIFSQELTKEEANQALRNFDAFFKENGILFAYPVHGGWMGWDAKKGSFGKTRVYDSLAPEFETYGTIKGLAPAKSGR